MDEIRAELFSPTETPDLTQFPPLPPGNHLLEVIAVKPGTASTGRGRFGFQIKIVGSGEHDDKKGWYNLNMPATSDPVDGYIRKLWKKLAELCPDAVAPTGAGDHTIRPDSFVGLQFRAMVTVEDYEGKPQNRYKNETWLGYPNTQPEAPSTFQPAPSA